MFFDENAQRVGPFLAQMSVDAMGNICDLPSLD
jgi:hypothetical protein